MFHEGVLRIDPARDRATEMPCPYRLQKELTVRLNVNVTARFRIVRNTTSPNTVDLFLDFGENLEKHHFLGWISDVTTSASLKSFDKSIIKQARDLFADLPPESRGAPPTRFERIIRDES